MPGLTDADKALLSDDERALLSQFEGEGDNGAPAEPDEGANDAGTPGDGGEQQGSGEEGGAEGTPEPEPEAPAATTLKIGDREVPIADLQNLLEFQEWTRQNPDKMQAFGDYLNGRAEFVIRKQEEKPAEPTVDWDLVDPSVKTLYEKQEAQLAELRQNYEALQNPVQQWQQSQIDEAQRRAAIEIEQATKQVGDRFSLDLNEKEINELHETTAALNILPGLRTRIADPVEAVATALEMAIWQTPKFRDRIVDGQVTSKLAKDKRQLAGIVGGGSGSDRSGLQSSTGDQPGKNMSREDRQKAMAAEIAESMRGTA